MMSPPILPFGPHILDLHPDHFDTPQDESADASQDIKFQNEYVKVQRSSIYQAGYGLFAKKVIPAGYVITEYKGRIRSRLNALSKKRTFGWLDESYAVDIHPNSIVPESKACFGMYINDPFQTTTVNCCFITMENQRVMVVTCVLVRPEEELFTNYGDSYWIPTQPANRILEPEDLKMFQERQTLRNVYRQYVASIREQLKTPKSFSLQKRGGRSNKSLQEMREAWFKQDVFDQRVCICPTHQDSDLYWYARWSLYPHQEALLIQEGGLIDHTGMATFHDPTELCSSIEQTVLNPSGLTVWLIIDKKPSPRSSNQEPLGNFPQLKNLLFDPRVRFSEEEKHFYYLEEEIKVKVELPDKWNEVIANGDVTEVIHEDQPEVKFTFDTISKIKEEPQEDAESFTESRKRKLSSINNHSKKVKKDHDLTVNLNFDVDGFEKWLQEERSTTHVHEVLKPKSIERYVVGVRKLCKRFTVEEWRNGQVEFRLRAERHRDKNAMWNAYIKLKKYLDFVSSK